MNGQEDYEKLIDYIEQQLYEGALKVGDRLPAERELSSILQISRGAVRIGLAVLVAIGIVDSRQGSGNYINGEYDHKLTQMMTMMYALCEMSQLEMIGFRYAAEQEAILLAHRSISPAQKEQLRAHLEALENASDAKEQILHDQMIHQIIVEASNNRLVIARYMALNKMLYPLIRHVRESIANMGPKEADGLQSMHRKLVEHLCNNNYQGAKAALDGHFYFLRKVIEAEVEKELKPEIAPNAQENE